MLTNACRALLYCVLLPVAAFPTGITVDVSNQGGPISQEVYGQAIYWGGSQNGLTDWIHTQEAYDDAMEKWYGYSDLVAEMRPTVLRIGGGLAGNGVEFEMIVGPITDRKATDSGRFAVVGTDEALRFAETIAAVPMLQIGVNAYAELFPQFDFHHERAARAFSDQVEYVNAPDDGSNPGEAHEPCPAGDPCRQDPSFDPATEMYNKDWARERALNGHAEPYGVRYWEFGNELYSMDVADYISAMQTIIPVMKMVDPTIMVGAVAHDSTDPTNPDLLAWDGAIFDEASSLFDFWIRHAHVPSCNEADARYYANKAVPLTIQVPVSGAYTFSVLAKESLRIFEIWVDDRRVDIINTGLIILPIYLTSAPVFIDQGEHIFTLNIVNKGGAGQYMSVHTIVEMRNEDTGEVQWLDLKDSEEIYYSIQSALQRQRGDTFARPYLPLVDGEECDPQTPGCLPFGGKPVFITEWGMGYGSDGYTQPLHTLAGEFRETFNNIAELDKFIRAGVPTATYWSLFGELQRRGPIEGVAMDHRGRSEDTVSGVYSGWFEPGRPNDDNREPPHRRPLFHLFKLFSELFRGSWIELAMTDRGFVEVGLEAIEIMCTSREAEAERVYFIDAMAALSDDSHFLTLMISNKHLSEAIPVEIDLVGFEPVSRARLYTVRAEQPSEHNDPEECLLDTDGDIYADCLPNTRCPHGDCIVVEEAEMPVSSRFTFTAEKLSFNFLVLDNAQGADIERLLAWRRNDEVVLAWTPHGAASRYGVYRYEDPSSPILPMHLIGEPIASEWSDPLIPDGPDRFYQVFAVLP